MTAHGVFAVCRTIWDDPDFKDEPFTQREAFLWLVSAAVWKARRVRGGRGPIELERGELCFSVRFLAEKWGWSKSRVGRFLKLLKKRDTLRDTSRDGANVILIKNYSRFQIVWMPDDDGCGTASGTAAGQQRDKEEDRLIQVNNKNGHFDSNEKAGREAGEILRSLTDIPDDAKSLHDATQQALIEAGFSIECEHRIGEIGNGQGRIDLVVTKNDGAVAIELDNRKPQSRSIVKLRKFEGYRIIGLRGVAPLLPIDDIDEIIGISVRQMPDSFHEFWASVPRKVARRAAEKAYRSALRRGNANEILEGMIRYSESVKGTEAKYIAHPASWLNADRWKDEEAPPEPKPRVGQGQFAIRPGTEEAAAWQRYYNRIGGGRVWSYKQQAHTLYEPRRWPPN